MKRVARADSPEVVRVSEVSPESSFRELDDVFLQTHARIWLGEVLHIRFDEETPIADLLADGELLFQLSKVVWKMLLKKHDELKNSKIFVYERTSFAKSDGRYIPYPKVDSFLKICQIIGLTGIDLFSPSDVVEKRDIRRVCMCIRCLSKQARSKNLSVPDFDIVTYTIAMPTDLVGGIRRSLEQSGCSSSSSGNCSKGFRRLYRQKDYSEHHDQRHDYCYESDEAESSFNELEFERLPSNISYGASDIFTLDGEGCPQGRLGGDNLSKLRTYFELEGQTHGENGHESEHHGASIFLESIGSPFGSITENGSHDTSITVQSDSCLPCTKLQTDESASPYSIGEEQGVQPLGWSRFGEQVWNSDIDCCQRCFLSCAKSPYEVEAQMGGKESQSYLDFVPKNFLPKSSTFDTHISTGDANEENIKSCVGGTSKKVSNARDRHDNVECECEIQHEKDQDGSSAYMLQSHDGELRCKNMTWLLDEKDDGKHKTSIHDNWKMTPGSSVVEWVSSDLTCQNMHHADIVLLDSEVPGSLSSLSMRNEGSQGKGSRCEQEMGIIDQAIDAEESSTPTLKLIPDKAATVPNDDKLHHDNLSAENFLFPEVHAFKNNAKSSLISEVSSIEHGTNRNWKDGRIVRPQNCDSYFDFEDVASAFKTIEWTQPCQSDGLNDSWTTISKGQDFTGILDGSFPKDTLSANTCSTSTYGTLEAERRLPLDTAIPEKTNIFNFVLARDANRQLNCSAVHQDEDSTVDIVSAINTKTCGKIVGSQMDKIDWHLIGSQSELKAENHDTQNECEMVIKVDGQDNGSYHDPCEANIDLSVVVGSNLFKKKLNKSNHHMECENISGSFRESSSVLSGLDTNYEHPIFVSTADDSCMPTCSRDYSEQTLPVEARNIRDSHSSVPTGMFSVHDTSYVCLQHIDKSILKTSYKTSPQTRNDVAGRNCVNNLDPYCRNEICRLGTGGAGVAKNSEVPYSCCSKDLRHMEYMGSYNANKVTSDRSYGSGTVSTSKPVHCSTTAHTSAPADSDDDCTTTQTIWQCSNPGILAEGKGDISAEVNFENKYQVHHLVDDVGTSMNHTVPDATEERKKDMEECSKNPLTTMTSSGKSREETVAKVRNPGKKVLKSIAGGVTLIGALLFFLHLRRKREKEKNSHTVAPLPTKETFQEVYTQNKMEIDKSDKKYPGERLKL